MKVYDQLKKENKTLKSENGALRVNLDRALIIIKENSVGAEREKTDIEKLQFDQDSGQALADLMKKHNPDMFKTITQLEFNKTVQVFRAGAKWWRDK
jgi:topoisomerase IA-like protein